MMAIEKSPIVDPVVVVILVLIFSLLFLWLGGLVCRLFRKPKKSGLKAVEQKKEYDYEIEEEMAKKGRKNYILLVYLAILIFLLAGLVLSIIH
jgi:hypothetical protein